MLSRANPHTEKDSGVSSGLCKLLRREGLLSGEFGEKKFPALKWRLLEASSLLSLDIMARRQEAKTCCSYFCHHEGRQPGETTSVQAGCNQGDHREAEPEPPDKLPTRPFHLCTFGWCTGECTYYLIQFELGFLLLSTQNRQTAKLSQATLREISRCLLVVSTWPAAWHLAHCPPADLAMRSVPSVHSFVVYKRWSERKKRYNVGKPCPVVRCPQITSCKMSFNSCKHDLGISERVPG